MEEQSGALLSGILRSRSRILELVVAAVVLGFGVHLLASYTESRISSTAVLVCGVAATTLALALLLRQAGWFSGRTEVFKGFFVYDVEANVVPPHDTGYWFGASFAGYFSAAFAENPALRVAWDSEPLSARYGEDWKTARFEKSRALVKEATEYFVLSSLSAHLLDYFGAPAPGDNGDLTLLHHSDIPDVLLQNRFLKLFSESMDQRAAFIDATAKEKLNDGDGTVYWQHSAGGALYARFELVLPTGSSVRRLASGQVEIDTPRFKLVLHSEFDGLNTNVPSQYLQDFMGLGDVWTKEGGVRLASYGVRVRIVFSPKGLRVLSPTGWEYYQWVDEWLTQFAESFEQDAYFRRIGFDQAMTVIRLLRPRSSTVTSHRDDQIVARANGDS